MKADFVYTEYSEKKMGFLFVDHSLTEALFFSDDEMLGSICTATVTKIVPTMGAAFLEGPEGLVLFYQLKENEGRHRILRKRGSKKNGMIPGRYEQISVGDTILVQVSATPQKGKQAEASANLSLKNDAVVVNCSGQVGISKKIRDPERREELKELLLNILREETESEDFDGFGFIARTSAAEKSDDELREVSIILLCQLRGLIKRAETTPEHKWLYRNSNTPEAYVHQMVQRGLYEEIAVHTDLEWEDPAQEGYRLNLMSPERENPGIIFNLPTLMEKAMSRKVYLKGGGYLYVETTEAMTVIDVNSGKNINGKSHEESALEQNLEAAAEIARLIRLLNLSGIIMIDFISMKKPAHDSQVMGELRRCTAQDPCQVHVVDMTKLGIVEVTREKKAPPLRELL